MTFEEKFAADVAAAVTEKLAKISKSPTSGSSGNPTASTSVGGVSNPYKNSPTVSAPNLASTATVNAGMSQGIANMVPQANSMGLATTSKAMAATPALPTPPMPPQGAMKPGWQS